MMGIFWKPFSFGESEAQEVAEPPKAEVAEPPIEVAEPAITIAEPPIEVAEPIRIGTPAMASHSFSESDIPNMSYEEINREWDNICIMLERA